jgi:hypothetical protein
MKKILCKTVIALLLLSFTQNGFSQLVISGQTCIIPNTVYQYVITGSQDSASSVQVCLSNGRLADSSTGSNCVVLSHGVNEALVMWNDSAFNNGSLAVTSSGGNASLNVHFAQELLPGSIDSAVKVQMLNYNTKPSEITCGYDSGGSCSPLYTYQWQSSSNMIVWTDMPGAVNSNLVIDSSLTQSVFYRRKVTETVSGSIGYSDAATVFVMVQHIDSIGTDTTSSTYKAPGFIQKNNVLENSNEKIVNQDESSKYSQSLAEWQNRTLIYAKENGITEYTL